MILECCDRCLDGSIDGALNFRDLGGHRAGSATVRRRMVYRSAMTHDISADGISMLAGAYGLRMVIDLRSTEEIAEYGTAPFQATGVSYHHQPLSSRAASPPEIVRQYQQEMREGRFDWTASYLRMVEYGAPALRSIFELVAAPDGTPAVFHCIAGRDRTGVVAALLLGSLGVSGSDIAADYAITGAHLKRQAHRFAQQAARLDLTTDQMTKVLETEADAMHRFLQALTDRHDSIDGAVRALGVRESTIATLRDTLLEPAADER
ncbi:MAG: tyrosine-protein phosphatase [Dehalococcoidia bacterium]